MLVSMSFPLDCASAFPFHVFPVQKDFVIRSIKVPAGPGINPVILIRPGACEISDIRNFLSRRKPTSEGVSENVLVLFAGGKFHYTVSGFSLVSVPRLPTLTEAGRSGAGQGE